MSLLSELRRRNVLRIAAGYAALSWLIIQVVETLFPMFGLSDAAARAVVLMLAIGFVPALALAWTFELTPDGLKRDEDVDRALPASRKMARHLDRAIVITLVLAVGYFAIDKFVLAPAREAGIAEQARELGRAEALFESYGDKSIAVLPFTDMSAARDQGYLSDGLAEELLNLLAKLHDLRVVARSSSFALRDEGLSIPDVADRLNVTYVLEGSVRKAGDKIRVTAQLIDARSDSHLWSQTYDRELDDIFAIQDQISAQVVHELEVRILGSSTRAVPTSAQAYDLYLRGLSSSADVSVGGWRHATEMFEQVIALDPSYAPAYGHMAIAQVWSDEEDSVRNPAIEAAAGRALELDPTNSNALAAIGRLRAEQGRNDEASTAFEQAIAYNPNNAWAYRWFGIGFGDTDPARYLALVRKAYLVNPLDRTIRYHVTNALTRYGRIDEALKIARDGLSLPAGESAAYALAGMIHEISGRQDLALKSLFRSYRAEPGSQWRFGWAGQHRILNVLGELGAPDLGSLWVKEIYKDDTESPWAYWYQIIMANLAGDEEAIRQLIIELSESPRVGLRDFVLGFVYLNIVHDFDSAGAAWGAGEEMIPFDAENWGFFVQYSFMLKKIGAVDDAQVMIDEIIAIIEPQMAAGVVIGENRDLRVLLAALRASNGEADSALAALQLDNRQQGLRCTPCLRNWPQFDELREDPRFEVVVGKHEAENEMYRQRLADEGMLLTPEALLALEDFDFDPFDD